MQQRRELPDNFKFISAAAVFAAGFAALVYGGVAVSGVQLDHNTGILLIIPILVTGLCSFLCMFQLPGAIAAWKHDPGMRTRLVTFILVVGWVMALLPLLALFVATGMK
jgi:hypothetical protein